jgi:hypothetical protein
VIIPINIEVSGVMVIRIEIEIWATGKCGTKIGGAVNGVSGWGRGLGVAGFCGPCVCLGVFLL